MHPRVYLWKRKSLGRARGYPSDGCPVTNRTRCLVASALPPASFDPPYVNITPDLCSSTQPAMAAQAAQTGDPDTHRRRSLATLPNTAMTEARAEGRLGKEECVVALSHARRLSGAPRVGGATTKWVLLMPGGWMPLLMARRHLSQTGVVRLTV